MASTPVDQGITLCLPGVHVDIDMCILKEIGIFSQLMIYLDVYKQGNAIKQHLSSDARKLAKCNLA